MKELSLPESFEILPVREGDAELGDQLPVFNVGQRHVFLMKSLLQLGSP